MPAHPLCKNGQPALDFAQSLVREAGAILMDKLRGEKEVHEKGWANIVTNVDLEVEAFLLARLSDQFPGCALLSEESGRGGVGELGLTWIVDPLDGTRNYAQGIPHFCVTMALAAGEEALLGVTYDPNRNELFWAERGGGAYCNGLPMRVSTRNDIENGVLGADLGYDDKLAAQAIELLRQLWPGMQGVRVMGSAALGIAYAAGGRLDLYFHHSLASWDIAAGVLLVREAGGVVTNRDGRPAALDSPSIVASSPQLVARFLKAAERSAWRNAAR